VLSNKLDQKFQTKSFVNSIIICWPNCRYCRTDRKKHTTHITYQLSCRVICYIISVGSCVSVPWPGHQLPVREMVPCFHVGLPSLSMLKAVHSASHRISGLDDNYQWNFSQRFDRIAWIFPVPKECTYKLHQTSVLLISEWPHIQQKHCNNIRFGYMPAPRHMLRFLRRAWILSKPCGHPYLQSLEHVTSWQKSAHAKCNHKLKQTSFAKSCARQIPVRSCLAVLTEVRDMSPNSFECRACCRRLRQQAMVANRNISLWRPKFWNSIWLAFVVSLHLLEGVSPSILVSHEPFPMLSLNHPIKHLAHPEMIWTTAKLTAAKGKRQKVADLHQHAPASWYFFSLDVRCVGDSRTVTGTDLDWVMNDE